MLRQILNHYKLEAPNWDDDGSRLKSNAETLQSCVAYSDKKQHLNNPLSP